MIISLDFDNTITADLKMWLKFIRLVEEHGHTVVCVSSRDNNQFNRDEIEKCLPSSVKVFLCGSTPKETYMRLHSVTIDIWIDDDPIYIPSNCVRI